MQLGMQTLVLSVEKEQYTDNRCGKFYAYYGISILNSQASLTVEKRSRP